MNDLMQFFQTTLGPMVLVLPCRTCPPWASK